MDLTSEHHLMPVMDNAERTHFSIPGIDHQTLASHLDGLAGLEIWYQTIEPKGETPLHYHECEEAVVVLGGSGRAIIDGESRDFGPSSTLIIPAGVVHQLLNSGDEPIQLLASLSASPARVYAPDGSEFPVPWLD